MGLPEKWSDQFDKYDTDPFGPLLKVLKESKDKLPGKYITDSKLKKLEKMKDCRNYWAHQCFVGEEGIYFKKDKELGENVLRKQEDVKQVKRDLGDAKDMAQYLDDVYLDLFRDTGLREQTTKELNELFDSFKVEVVSVSKVDLKTGKSAEHKIKK